MAIEKKSLISNRAAAKKALVASRPEVNATPTPNAKITPGNVGKYNAAFGKFGTSKGAFGKFGTSKGAFGKFKLD
jgi:hypothetical protein